MYRICYVISKKYVFRVLTVVSINLVALLLSAPFNVLLIVLHFVHFLLKWIVLIIYDRFTNTQFSGIGRKILKGEDYGWLEERWQESVLQAVLVFDSKINVRRIQELITARVIPLYPRLTYKILPLPFTAGSVHCWIPDDSYDINRHVFTDNVDLSDDQLQIYVSQIVSTKLPTDKPPWELRIVSQSVDCSSTDTIVILRVHQCLADGMTLIKILCTKLADTRASYTAFKSHFKFSHYLRSIQAFCIGPALVLYKLAKMYKNRGNATSPATVVNGGGNGDDDDDDDKNYVINWSTSISMSKIDRIKQVTRSSYNCVFLSAVTGGFRYVLQNSGIKHPPDLKITFPFATGLNEKFVPVTTFVPVSMEGAIPRLWQTKRQLKSLRNSRDLLVTSFVTRVLMPLCPSFYVPVLCKLLHKSANVQFNSIVGPTTRLVIDGSPLKIIIYPLLPCQSDLGISTAVSTYVDQVYITVITHSSLKHIGKMLLRFVEEQLDRMYLLLVNRTIPEDLGDDQYFQNQLPDISGLPSKELKSRMQVIQRELQRLSEMLSYNDDDIKRFSHFKSEFSHIFKELRRRKSVKIRRPSIFVQTAENLTSAFACKRSVSEIFFPFKGEVYKETIRSLSETEPNKKTTTKLKQINFEETVQMIFYKKITSKHSFRGCNYSDTNKYIYLTLVNENNTMNERDIVHDTISNQNYLSELQIEKQKLFYQLKSNEQII